MVLTKRKWWGWDGMGCCWQEEKEEELFTTQVSQWLLNSFESLLAWKQQQQQHKCLAQAISAYAPFFGKRWSVVKIFSISGKARHTGLGWLTLDVQSLFVRLSSSWDKLGQSPFYVKQNFFCVTRKKGFAFRRLLFWGGQLYPFLALLALLQL